MLWTLPYTTTYELYVAALRLAITVAVFMSVAVCADRLFLVWKYFFFRTKQAVTGVHPLDKWKFAELPPVSEMRKQSHLFPKVALQLPMFNERAVCQSVIDCASEMHWPWDRLHIQVLDDSTCKITRQLVDDKAEEWRERGVDVRVIRRTNRKGYKAGALKEGMLELKDFSYIAIFDADFKPDPDFLMKTIPYLEGNSELGYVQARWTFINPEESYLTKTQEISLNYHVKCEQFVHFASGSFFNFNGTAGVWRRKAIESVGGWFARTTVEDMDLSLRAYLAGWKAIFLEGVVCLNELPASFFAYRKQQHRWTCGPVQLWRKAHIQIWQSRLPLLRKLELSLLYFGVRKFSCHWVNLGFFCMLVPLSVFVPEVSIPLWALVHLPVTVSVCSAMFTPRGLLHAVLYVLFENAMGIVKVGAVVAGLLDLQRAGEWVVTTKLGSSDHRPNPSGVPASKGLVSSIRTCRLYAAEALMSMFVLGTAVYGIVSVERWSFCIFLVLQGLAFLAFGFNMVDVDGWLGSRPQVHVCSKKTDAKLPVSTIAGPPSQPLLNLGRQYTYP